MSITTSIYALAERLGHLLSQQSLRCVVAESCTGGGLSAAITDIPGSSQWFDRGFVTYSNESKIELLSVPVETISLHGAVSEATVCAMASGALAASHAELSVAISGLAGPGGGSFEKPVGTVWVAWAYQTKSTDARCYVFKGDRLSIRQQAVKAGLEGLIQCLS